MYAMPDQPPLDDRILGTVRKPANGWGPAASHALNQLVRRLAADHDWRNLVVRMHQSTWNQVAMHLNYNLSFPKPGVPMECQGFEDPGRIEVVFRSAAG